MLLDQPGSVLSGYRLPHADVLLVACGILAALVALGLLVRRGGRGVAWAAGPLAVAGIHFACLDEAAGTRMVLLVLAMFLWMKAVVTAEAAARGERLPVGRWLAFALLWPGMRQRPFAKRARRAGVVRITIEGLVRVAAGVALVVAAHALRAHPWLATIPLLVGLSFALHFGLFRVATGVCRMLGFDCREPFRQPHRSTTLAEFWSRRWNVPFTEMVQDTVYRRLRRFPAGVATLAGFAFSAALHEVALSLPVRAGFGLPTAYFCLHGVLVLVERRLGIRSRVWAAAWVIVPAPLVFHAPFLRGVVWPIAGLGIG